MTWTWACKYVLQIGDEVVRYIIREFLFRFLSLSYGADDVCNTVPVFVPTPVAVDEKADEKQDVKKDKAESIPVAEVD